MEQNKPIKFYAKSFILKRKLDSGACGQAHLLYDEFINQYFVCKKFIPADNYPKNVQNELYKNFINEVKCLYVLHHTNICRIFDYYKYEKEKSAYIVMEYIDGKNIQEYLETNNIQINDIFLQCIEGFIYLETNNILHRDIRVNNIMVNNNGIVKIIDFGFSKIKIDENDYQKSLLSLNWIASIPNEFKNSIYNHKTDMYFLGHLFKQIIEGYNIKYFSYENILNRMCELSPEKRFNSFSQIKEQIFSNKIFLQSQFSDEEIYVYRTFASILYDSIEKIKFKNEYHQNIDIILQKLFDVHDNHVLEEYINDTSQILNCFSTDYRIHTFAYKHYNSHITTELLKDFLEILKKQSAKKKSIILKNLYTKFNDKKELWDEDDIPF